MPASGPGQHAAPGPPQRAGNASRVEALLRQQHDLFTRLDALSDQQAALIEQEQTDRLLAVLAERQVFIEDIARISAELEPWRARWTEFVGQLPESERTRIREIVDAVAALAERIARRDERDRQLMESRKTAITAELGQVNRGRGAIAAYATGTARTPGGHGAPLSAGPRFQDREA